MQDQQSVSVLLAKEDRVRGSMRGPIVRGIYLIECCTEGKGSVIINGTEFPFSAGACYALLPGDAVQHTTDPVNKRVGFTCALDGVQVGTYLKNAGITAQAPFFPASYYEEIRNWLEMMAKYWPNRDAGAQLRLNGCAMGLMGTLLQGKPAPEKGTLVDKAIGFMQTDYHKITSMAEVAEQIGLERTYFSELFKETTGFSPYQYITRLRIQKACRLLETSKYTMADIAEFVGLGAHNFSRLFKKEVGITPLKYRQNSKQPGTRTRERISKDENSR